MDAPKCKLCGVKHLLSEPHAFDDTKQVRSQGFKRGYRLPAEQSMITAVAVKHCKTCRCFPMTAAERQKAYRERHKK